MFEYKCNIVLQLYTCTWITTIKHIHVNNNLIIQDLIFMFDIFILLLCYIHAWAVISSANTHSDSYMYSIWILPDDCPDRAETCRR